VRLPRRLAAIVYDGVLLAGVLFAASLPLPLFPAAVQQTAWFRWSLRGYLLLVGFVFFGWFWSHGGQTLGMRAWRIRVVITAGDEPGWRQAGIRYAVALGSWAALGGGFLWSLLDRDRRCWHDILSGTRLVLVPRRDA
jgi:uncharacterized RDD family membrane protein YckC